MDTKALRQKILDLAIRGKLVPQDPNDEPASVLLERIRAEKQQMVKDGKLKTKDIKNDTVIFKGEDNLHYEKFADGTVKCIEEEIPFDVPDAWSWSRLENCCCKEIKRGKSPKYAENGSTLVFAQKCNTKYDGINIGLSLFLDDNTLNKYPDTEYMQNNDIVINSTGTGTLGRVGIYKDSHNAKRLPIVPDSHVTIIRAYKSLIADYVYTYMKAKQPQIEKMGEGSTNQKELKPLTLKKLLICIPPFPEQHRITEKLTELISFIDTIETGKLNLKETIQATKSKILDLAIRGKLVPQDPNDEPASVLLERIRTEKEELIKQGKIKRDKKESVIFKGEDNSYYEKVDDKITCIDEEIPFEIPDSWIWCRLENCCNKEIKRGKSPKYAETGSTLVFAQKCNTKYSGIDIGLSLFLDNSILCKYPNTEFMQDGDIVINSTGTGTLGRVGIYRSVDNRKRLPIVPDSHITIIRTYKSLLADYVYAYMKASQSQLEKMGEGSTNQKELKPLTLKNFLIPIPPKEEQKAIASKVTTLFSYLDSIAELLD